MDPEIRHLRTICAIADTGSLSAAARRLGVSQPGLSAQLRRIERALGGQLFSRSRTGVRPTDLGERTVGRARPLLAELDALIGGLHQPDTAEPLRIGTVHMECVGTMINLVRTALNGMDLRMTIEPSALVLAHALEHGRLDLAVIGAMDDHDISLPPTVSQRTLIPRVPVYVAIGRHHRLAQSDQIALSDLADEIWICPPGADDGSLASLRAACRKAGFEARIGYEAPSGGGRQLIAEGLAVRLVEPTALSMGGMIVKPLAEEPLRMRLSLAWRPGRLDEAQLDRVYRAVARAYSSHAESGRPFATWWASHPQVHPFW